KHERNREYAEHPGCGWGQIRHAERAERRPPGRQDHQRREDHGRESSEECDAAAEPEEKPERRRDRAYEKRGHHGMRLAARRAGMAGTLPVGEQAEVDLNVGAIAIEAEPPGVGFEAGVKASVVARPPRGERR